MVTRVLIGEFGAIFRAGLADLLAEAGCDILPAADASGGILEQLVDSQAMTSDFDRRSLQVLRMLADGAAIREISSSLGWSERTIKGVIADIQREFQARSRTQAVVEALRRQLI